MISKTADGKMSHPREASETADACHAGVRHITAVVMAQDWMERVRATGDAEKTVVANELTSLSALVAWVARNLGVSEFGVERDLADRFNIANVKYMPASSFDDAIRYLVDRVPAQARVA